MEKHILWKMINESFDFTVKDNEFRHLDLEFIKQYHLLKDMKALGVDINKEQLKLFAMVEQKEIDLDYATQNILIKDNELGKTWQTFITKKEGERDISDIRRLINNYVTNDNLSLQEAKEKIERLLNKDNNVIIKPLTAVKETQKEFLETVFSGKEVDGLYLYSPIRTTSRQFMKLSYRLKYIAKTDLVFIGGRPSVGKTSFMLSIMNNLAKNGYRGLMFSLEMTAEQVIHRMTTAKSNISNDKIFGLDNDKSDIRYQYNVALEHISELPIDIIDENITSWLQMKQIIIDNIKNYDYVAIDHLTYIPTYDGDYGLQGHHLINLIVREMKQLAKEYEIPMLVLAQLNRGVGSGAKKGGDRLDDRYVEIFMRDFRESGSIEEYADKILLLYRQKDSDHEKYHIYKTTCSIGKNRAGSIGKVDYWFYANVNRWREVDDNE